MQNIDQKPSFRSEVTQTYLDALNKPIPLFVDRANYLAIKALEKIGFTDPDQEKIDVIETLISLAGHKEHLTPEKFDFCTGTDTVARRIFLRHIKENTGV